MSSSVLTQALAQDWTFAQANTKEGTHVIHTYPAMMIPQVARGLIALLRHLYPAGQTLLDPFAGSGTVLVEGMRAGLSCWGNDLNPLAQLIARARTTVISAATAARFMAALPALMSATQTLADDPALPLPTFEGRDFWFQPDVIRHLSALHQILKDYEHRAPELTDLLWATFSETLRLCSNTRNSEFKLYRMPAAKLATWNPSVEETFSRLIERYLHGMAAYRDSLQAGRVTLIQEDTRALAAVPAGRVDFVVTSPPYGDSHTTVAYGQFSRLALEWLGFPPHIARQVDNTLLGGRRRAADAPASDSLRQALDAIAAEHPARAAEVTVFYADFAAAFARITQTLHPGSLAAWVVANRTVKGVMLPTHRILSELAVAHGYELLPVISRDIPNKRMPRKNSPSNVPGATMQTMTQEHLVLLRYHGSTH